MFAVGATGMCTQLQPTLKEYHGQLIACFAVEQDLDMSFNQ